MMMERQFGKKKKNNKGQTSIMRKSGLILFFFSTLIVSLIFLSCKKDYGIVYKIFNSAFKSDAPLTAKPSEIDTSLIGSYILGNEITVSIEKMDSAFYEISFLPSYLRDEKKTLYAFISEIRNQKYLNIRSLDYQYLFFKINNQGDSILFEELSNKANKLFGEEITLELIRKGIKLPDSVFFPVPLIKVEKHTATNFSKNKLSTQIRDIQSYYKFAELFPNDSSLPILKKTAIQKTLAGYYSIEKLQKLIRQYPEFKDPAALRARSLCYTTKNCVDFMKFYPYDLNHDSLTDKAFQLAANEDDYILLINEFPLHALATSMMAKLYFSNDSKKKIKEEKLEMHVKNSSKGLIGQVNSAIKTFDRIPFEQIKFNNKSYVATSSGNEMLDKISYTIKELNKDKKILHDIYILVQCRDFSIKNTHAEMINFRISINRAIQLKKKLGDGKLNNTKFHFIPIGVGSDIKDSSGSFVRFTLNPFEAERYRSRFVKQCFRFMGVVIPGLNGEFASEDYLPDPELENYCFDLLKKNLQKNPSSQIKIIPCHFIDEKLANGNNDYQRVYARFSSLFVDRKLRKRSPEEFMIPIE
jgi:hypothetical protein